jgi:hypothetical protein
LERIASAPDERLFEYEADPSLPAAAFGRACARHGETRRSRDSG